MVKTGIQEKDDSDMISIILPTFNRRNTLEKAIISVINQTYEYWELIIVDDASVDDTKNLVKKFMDKDSRIIYIHESQNRGANYCRNIGVRKSRGKYLAFLDSDNYWEEDKLAIQIEVIRRSKEDVAFVFCSEVISNEGGEYFFPDKKYLECEVGEALLITNIVDTNTALVKRKCFEKTGGFDEKMPRLQDWEFFFRLVNVYRYKAVYIPKCLNNNVIQKDSITKNSRKYVDAIFSFLSKYPELFCTLDLIMLHVWDAFLYGTEEEDYVCQKIYEIYSGNQEIMQGILLNLYKVQNMRRQRQHRFYTLLYEWKLKNSKMEGTSLFFKIFKKKDMTIAIYGLGRWGELFYQELKSLPIKILYGIDKNVIEFHSLPVKKPDEQLEEVDLLVITVFQEFEKIKSKLQEKYKGKIVSIEELIKQI